MRSAGPGDDQGRFLADLRALRDVASIGHDELAARAHYPSDVLKEAENGPYLPSLPILAAYVRACEGDVPEWEERWRRLAHETCSDLGLPVRPVGASPAAVAGARAGVGVAPPDVYDPERIKAALRGGYQDSGRDGQPAAWGGTAGTPDGMLGSAGWRAGSGWFGGAGQGGASANGNHQAKHRGVGSFGATVNQVPDLAECETHLADPEPPTPNGQDGEPIPGEPSADRLTWAAAEPQERTEDGRTWAIAEPPQEPTVGGLAWAATDNGTTVQQAATPGPARRGSADRVLPQRIRPGVSPGRSAAVQEPKARQEPKSAEIPAERAAPTERTAPTERGKRHDRFYAVRLLLIVVIAALIGSGLVLLLR